MDTSIAAGPDVCMSWERKAPWRCVQQSAGVAPGGEQRGRPSGWGVVEAPHKDPWAPLRGMKSAKSGLGGWGQGFSEDFQWSSSQRLSRDPVGLCTLEVEKRIFPPWLAWAARPCTAQLCMYPCRAKGLPGTGCLNLHRGSGHLPQTQPIWGLLVLRSAVKGLHKSSPLCLCHALKIHQLLNIYNPLRPRWCYTVYRNMHIILYQIWCWVHSNAASNVSYFTLILLELCAAGKEKYWGFFYTVKNLCDTGLIYMMLHGML